MSPRRAFLITSIAAVALASFAALIGVVVPQGHAATAVAPSNIAPPTISGTTIVGRTLKASHGSWSGTDPFDFAYRWLRCDQDGGSCSGITGATDTSYVLKSVDRGNTLRVRVTASNSSGSDSSASVPTSIVRAATSPPPSATGCPATASTSLAISAISPPARLTIDQAQVQPSTVAFSTHELTMRFHVVACGGQPVQGALVYATAVPYDQFSIPNEQPTGSDGWGSLDFRSLGGFPVSSKQQILVVFVRARKSGESVLGGISTRRLVSFHVTR